MDCNYDIKEMKNGSNVIRNLKPEVHFINPKFPEKVKLISFKLKITLVKQINCEISNKTRQTL